MKRNKIIIKNKSKNSFKSLKERKKSTNDFKFYKINKKKNNVFKEIDQNRIKSKVNICKKYITKNSLINRNYSLNLKFKINKSKIINKNSKFHYYTNKLIIPNFNKKIKNELNINNHNNNTIKNDFKVLKYYLNYLNNLKVKDFLKNHNLDCRYRNKLIDWIIEVIFKYKFSEQCFFVCINILDTYFSRTNKILDKNDLHLLGITIMYICIKYEEINYLNVKIFSENISYNKIKIKEIINKESEILMTLNFELTLPNIYEISILIIKILDYKNSLKNNEYYKFKKYFSFISKAILFNYDILIKYNLNLIIGTIILMSFKFSVNLLNEIIKQKKMICYILNIKLKNLELICDKLYSFFKLFKVEFYNYENILEYRNLLEF